MSQPHEEADHRSTTGAPVWVKVFGAIALLLVVLLVILHLTGHAPLHHTA